MNKKKVLIFAPYFYPHKGGLENFCLEIANRLSKKGFEVSVATSIINNEKIFENANGINIYRFCTRNILGGTYPIVLFNKSNKKTWKKLKDEKFDISITNTRFFLLSLFGQQFAKKNNIRSFHIEHGTCHPQLKNILARFCAYLYDQTLGRITIKLADKVIAISEAAAKFAHQLGANKIDIIYNSIDTSLFKINQNNKRNNTIIYIGRLIEAKGIQDLIQAVNNLSTDEYELLIIGDGNYKNILKNLAQENPKIKFLGEKNQAEIILLLNKSLIFVNPSYSEGLPTSVLEAGAMENAVIATDVGGTNEIIINGENGFLIPIKRPDIIEEKLNILISNHSLQEKFSNNIQQTIKSKFDWNTNIEKLANLLDR